MSRRPATFTQADVARVIRAAKQAGASVVEVKVGETTAVVHLTQSTGQPEAPETERVVRLS